MNTMEFMNYLDSNKVLETKIVNIYENFNASCQYFDNFNIFHI